MTKEIASQSDDETALDEESSSINDALSDESTSDTEDELTRLEDLTISNDETINDLADEPPLVDLVANFRNGVSEARSICEKIKSKLEQIDINGQLDDLRRKALKLSTWANPARRRIGIVGDSAAGKSSLINSLLNFRNLAHKGDHGSAVTSFITEYHCRAPRHKAKFTVEAEFMNEDEVKLELHELLFNYRDLYRPGLAQELEGSDQEYMQIERKSEVAFMTLESIFSTQVEITKEFLLSEPVEEVERKLNDLAARLPWPEGSSQGRWTAPASTASDCRLKVTDLMKNELWPLTYIVRIFLDAKVLDTGLVLADLPGLRDTNIARMRRVEQYLFSCDNVFVVANINRAVTDQSVKTQILDRGSKLQSMKNICVICTHADEIDIAASEARWKEITALQSTKSAKREVRNARKSNNAAAVTLAGIKYKNIFMEARNNDVMTQLKLKYAPHVEEIQVFCVGNKDYEGHDYWEPQSRKLAVQGSGIPDLRRSCYSIVEGDSLREAKHFLEVEVPDLVHSIKLLKEAVAETDSTPSLPIDLIEKLQDGLSVVAEQVLDMLESELATQLLDHWAPHQHEFDDSATQASLDWTSYHHTQYKAWVRNNGTHSTRLKSARWNQEILQQMNTEMSICWDMLSTDVTRRLDRALSLISDVFCKTDEVIEDIDPESNLRASLKIKQQALNHNLRKQWKILLHNIQKVRYNATGDHLSSYTLITMIPTYRHCAYENGPGTQSRMHSIMARRMRQRDIFRNLYGSINTECQRAFQRLHTKLRADATAVCQELEGALETENGAMSAAGSATEDPSLNVKALDELVEMAQKRLGAVNTGDEIDEASSSENGGVLSPA